MSNTTTADLQHWQHRQLEKVQEQRKQETVSTLQRALSMEWSELFRTQLQHLPIMMAFDTSKKTDSDDE